MVSITIKSSALAGPWTLFFFVLFFCLESCKYKAGGNCTKVRMVYNEGSLLMKIEASIELKAERRAS